MYYFNDYIDNTTILMHCSINRFLVVNDCIVIYIKSQDGEVVVIRPISLISLLFQWVSSHNRSELKSLIICVTPRYQLFIKVINHSIDFVDDDD